MDEDQTKAEIERLVLTTLDTHQILSDSLEFSLAHGLNHTDVVGVILSLSAAGMVEYTMSTYEKISLTEEGRHYVSAGSPEAQVLLALPENGLSKEELISKVGATTGQIGFSQAMRLKWIRLENGIVQKAVTDFVDSLRNTLADIDHGTFSGTQDDIKNLKKRKLVQTISFKKYKLLKGPSFALTRKVFATDLTSEMLHSHSWKTATFKEYNYLAKGRPLYFGTLHPLMKVREQFRSILLEMG